MRHVLVNGTPIRRDGVQLESSGRVARARGPRSRDRALPRSTSTTRSLDDLRRRLAQTALPDEIDDTGWEYGIPLDYLRELVEYWRDVYDWRAQEARLNELAHFRTVIDGQSIHFVHAPLAARGRAAAAAHPRLARLDRRVPRRHPAAHRPRGTRRARRRRVPRGRAVAAGLRLLGADPHTRAGTPGASRARSSS